MAKRVGVILSGCGVNDGSEIHEAVLTMLALDRAGAEMVMMAPSKPQSDVVDHVSGQPTGEQRNVLTESARIARGAIRDVKAVAADELDAIIMPGGFGAAKNLSNFASAGADCEVDPDVAKLLTGMHAARKPIAALCIAPAVLARVFGERLHPEITIGTDASTAKALEALGAHHRDAGTTDIVIDRDNRMVTTPCYMLAGRISEVADGARKAVDALLEMIEG
ncbi:MAG: isoprenoid biosynthesis glyoxalase ElbB [Candidatus Eiseniibacteriota bacterium]|jgi:enhancing lycopene biosynthesis protein 2